MEECGNLFIDTKDDKLYIIDPDDCVFKECGECYLNPFIAIFSFVFENNYPKGSQILYKYCPLQSCFEETDNPLPTEPSKQDPVQSIPVKF